MKNGTRLIAAAMALTMGGGVTTAVAQDEALNNEFGVGLYLGNCDSLVAGAALFDLGDAELETEDFSGSDENADENGDDESDLEGDLEGESSGDETDVEGAIGESDDSDSDSDSEVVVPAEALAVYVAGSTGFGANLVELVDAPFAVAARMGAEGSAEGGEDEFVSCGEFGGAVAGNELVIPLEPIGDEGLSGIAILERGEEEGESLSSVYLFGGPIEDVSDDEASDEEASDDEEPEGTPEA